MGLTYAKRDAAEAANSPEMAGSKKPAAEVDEETVRSLQAKKGPQELSLFGLGGLRVAG